MITERYERLPQEVNAIEVTEENLYSIAKWVKGVIKNTELKKSLQIIDFYNKEKQCEIRIQIGHFVIKKENQQFEVMSEKEFNETYRRIGL